MKTINKEKAVAIIAVIAISLTTVGVIASRGEEPAAEEQTTSTDTTSTDTTSTAELWSEEWLRLEAALIEIESGGNDKAVNGNCVGCLQITPIYVQELNDHGYEYKLSDRYDRELSIAMFRDMNILHNPTMDVEKAIRMHNPRGGKAYVERVKNLMQ